MRVWYVFHLLVCSAIESIELLLARELVSKILQSIGLQVCMLLKVTRCLLIAQNCIRNLVPYTHIVHIPQGDELFADSLELFPQFLSMYTESMS